MSQELKAGGHQTYAKGKFCLDKPALDIAKDSKKQISENKNILIKRNNTPNADIVIDADVGRIHQVLSNLINSSIKFIKKREEPYLSMQVKRKKEKKRLAAAKM